MIALNLINIVSIVGDFMNSVKTGLGLVGLVGSSLIMDCIAYPMAVHATFVKPLMLGQPYLVLGS